MKDYRSAIVVVALLLASQAAVGTSAALAADGNESTADASQAAALTVTVVDRFGNGIGDARLTAEWDGGETTARTISNGQALLDVEEGADVTIHVEHDAFVRNSPFVVRDAEDGQAVEITVYQTAEADVTVVEDDDPVADARVILRKNGVKAADGRTGADGSFATGTIERGTYEIVVAKSGYFTEVGTVDVAGTTEHTVEIAEGTVAVEFSVLDDHFDDPRGIEDANIEIEPTGDTLSTRSGGTRTVDLPVNTDYEITVSKDGYESRTRTVRVGERSRSLRFTISREDALNLELGNERVVAGEGVRLEVTDEYGDAVEGATVLVDGETVGETDASGVYEVTLGDSGTYGIQVTHSGVSSEEVSVEAISSGDGTPVTTDTATKASPGTATETPDDVPLSFDQPGAGMKAGAAAVGVILAFLVVRRLL